MKIASLIVILMASNSVVFAQTTAPTAPVPPGSTQGPWTRPKPGSSITQCDPGEYVAGIRLRPAARPAQDAYRGSGRYAGVMASRACTHKCRLTT